MNTFIADAAVTRVLGEELVALLQGATLPRGNCAACGQLLGDGPLRLSIVTQESGVLVAAVHASCGTSNLVHGNVLVLPPATWASAGGVLTAASIAPSRTWWGGKTERRTKKRVPIMIVTPTCDVFYLTRDRNDQLRTAIDDLFREGYERAGEVTFYGPGRDDVRATMTASTFTVTSLDLDEYSINVGDRFAAVVRDAGGLLLALTLEPFSRLLDGELDPDELSRITQSTQSAFTWIPTESIAGLSASE